MEDYLLTLWICLFIAYQIDSLIKRIQLRKRKKLLAERLATIPR